MRKIWIKKFNSFKEAEKSDREYYINETPEQRLSDIQFCREIYFSLYPKPYNESRKRLRRFYKVVEQV